MPVRIPNHLPAAKTLMDENIFVMTQARAEHQDIRPLKIALLNLMPTKVVTETQILRLIGNTPLQVDMVFLKTATHQSKNTAQEHMEAFYKTFDDIKDEKFDGLIITGAPVEQMVFEEVNYWRELTRIMDWAQKHVFSTLYICWAAQAGLYYRYGVNKHPLTAKMSGVFEHKTLLPSCKLTRGFDDMFFAPHSRHTEVRLEEIAAVPELNVVAVSDEAGVYLVASKDGKHIFATGHSEYDADTLRLEYERDTGKGLSIPVPAHYFPDDDPSKTPRVRWRSHASLLFTNWLNYYVYQETPFDITQIG